MVIPVPTLTTKGWVSSLKDKADMLLSDFFVADKLQTALYPNSVASLAYLVEQNFNDPIKMFAGIKAELDRYLRLYYPDGVIISVDSKEPLSQILGSSVTMVIAITIMEDGKEYSLAKLVEAEDTKIRRIINVNNNG